MLIFHGKLLVLTRWCIYIYCISCSIHSCASASTWTYHDIRTPGFIDCIDCLSTAQRGEQLDQLAVQHRCIHRGGVPLRRSHHGPCFWHVVLMQIGDSTSPNIYKNGDLPNKNADLNVFLLFNVIFTFQISDVKYEFLFSTHPPGISWEHH